MSSESIADDEGKPCPSKTGAATRRTGKKSVGKSENGPETDVKESRNIPTAGPKTGSHTPLPEVALSLPSPILTMSQATAIPETSVVYASDAISPMTPNIMQEPEKDELVLSATTANPRSLNGKNKSAKRSKELQRVLRNDESQMTLYQIQLEQWKPFNDRVKASVEIWGSSAKCKGGEHTVRAKQIAAAAQASGLNDPYASPGQRLMMATALYKGQETYDFAFQHGLDKTEWKNQWRETLRSVAEFFGLGNKKAVAARNKRKAA